VLTHSIAYVLAAILILSISTFTTVSAQQGRIQEKSKGDLEATLNGEVFRTGDTITVSGIIDKPAILSFLSIEVIDPKSKTVEWVDPGITAEHTFTYSFVAGGEKEFDVDEPMVTSGKYRMVVTYYENARDYDINEVQFIFRYIATSAVSSQSEEEEQQQQQQPITGEGATTGVTPQVGAPPPLLPTTIFQSSLDGIRLGVPDGWVVEDKNNTDPGILQSEQSYGAGPLVELCPQGQATPQIGGTYVCPNAQEGLDSVSVWRFANLKSRPEFAGVVQQNKNITTTDLVTFYFLFLEQKANFTNFRLLQNIDTAVNVIDPQTNETIGTAPAKYIVITYQDALGTPSNEDFALLVLNNDSNTGYALLPIISLLTTAGELPPEHQLIFDSFELVAANSTNTATIISAPQPSPFQQQLQQQ
jgi:hypothetical protein